MDEKHQTIRSTYDHAKDKDRVKSVDIDFTDQEPVLGLLVENFFDLSISKDHEMGIFLFGRRTITPDGRMTTIVESVFPSQSVDSRYFDWTSNIVTEELAELLDGQSEFQREWIGIVHTHPTNDTEHHRENFSPKGQSHSPDEAFYDDICKNSPGILFGLAYKNEQKIKFKFLHKGVSFSNPQIV